MLTKKYSEEFLKIYDKVTNDKRKIVKNIIKVENKEKIELLSWGEEQIILFLKEVNAESPQSLNKSMVALRKFANLICERENLPKQNYSIDDGVFLKLIDKDQLRASIISYEQYMNIKNQMDIVIDGKKANVRDKLIFELGWIGLTSEEIKMLKVSDIEFVESDTNTEVAILQLKNKIIRAEDPEVVMDIKLCEKETFCIKTAKDNVEKKTFYKDSEYLIKPVNMGRSSEKTYMGNPSVTLQRAIKSNGVICDGIDIDMLCLNDIRRSKLIYLLAPQNKEFFDFKTISGIFNLKTSTSLYWLRKIAKEKYK